MGWGLGEDIRDCYQCIATKYQPGDKLFLFGFSRGAFTARCLAAVICKYGIVELAAEADPERTIRRIYSEGYCGRKQLSALKFHPGSRSVNFLGYGTPLGRWAFRTIRRCSTGWTIRAAMNSMTRR